MTREDIFKRLEEVFKDVFELDEVALCDKTTAEDIDEWDSLSHIQLVVAVEKAFGIRFASREIMGWKNVGQMVSSILSKE